MFRVRIGLATPGARSRSNEIDKNGIFALILNLNISKGFKYSTLGTFSNGTLLLF